MNDDVDPSAKLGKGEPTPTGRLYGKLMQTLLDSPEANDEDVALTALAYALAEVAKCAEVPPHMVITNVARLVGATVEELPLGVARTQ